MVDWRELGSGGNWDAGILEASEVDLAETTTVVEKKRGRKMVVSNDGTFFDEKGGENTPQISFFFFFFPSCLFSSYRHIDPQEKKIKQKQKETYHNIHS